MRARVGCEEYKSDERRATSERAWVRAMRRQPRLKVRPGQAGQVQAQTGTCRSKKTAKKKGTWVRTSLPARRPGTDRGRWGGGRRYLEGPRRLPPRQRTTGTHRHLVWSLAEARADRHTDTGTTGRASKSRHLLPFLLRSQAQSTWAGSAGSQHLAKVPKVPGGQKKRKKNK